MAFAMRLHPTGLYVIIDTALLGRGGPDQLLESLLAAGVRWFQYRDKDGSDADILHAVSRLLPRCREAGARLLVNDRVRVAVKSGADGVHLGAIDMPVAEATRLLGPEKIIGRSARTVEDALRAKGEGADYLGVGSIAATATKPDACVIGVERLAEICRSVEVPVVAVGGITPRRVREIFQAGASGIAVASAVVRAPDPAAAAREFMGEVTRWRMEIGNEIP
ncbi:MAG: thiamine phosphate synthase [Candidatus Aureabacteria bacterium]|nr:thiamine phosphate synthase [Candidatus Auribacterota bacterium]